MFEKFSKKQEKVQEKIQKQQERNDKDCRELTDEELEQIVGGMLTLQLATVQLAAVPEPKDAKAVATVQLMTGGTQAVLKDGLKA